MAKKVTKKKELKKSNAEFDITNSLLMADQLTEKIAIEKNLIIKKALESNDIDAIFKAQAYLKKGNQVNKDSPQSLLIDPMSLNGLGYQDKPLRMSLIMMRNMGKIPVIRAITGTRIDQVCNFSQPQKDKYSTGFIIRPKKQIRHGEKEEKLTKAQEKRIEFLTEFILNCGGEDIDHYRHDSFENFLKKYAKDSLELDQAPIQMINTLGGDLYSFQAIDGATVRIADTYFKQVEEDYKKAHADEYVNGYLPYYVQVYMNRIINYYFPWEMDLGIRNPQTDIYSNGYGRSEMEDLITTITNILNADQYNANYFKVGSNPKGILRVTGNVNQTRLEEFRLHWQSQMAGVRNAHKLPIIEADKMDFINTQGSNKDMEYSKYYEFLIKIACAVFKMDPAEINFNIPGSSEQKPIFEGSSEAKLTHSKDKGLKPFLRFIQHKVQRLIDRVDDEYEFLFVGLEQQDEQQELQDNISKIQNFMQLNEVRRKYGLPDLSEEEGGNMILNPQLMSMQIQAKMMKQQQQQGSEMQEQPNVPGSKYEDENYGKSQEEENPFINKALVEDIERILCEPS